MSWLGLLNFVVLQWFGVRLARVTEQCQRVLPGGSVTIMNCHASGDITAISVGRQVEVEETTGWKLLRWVWPLTGWWSDYRWIGRARESEPGHD